MRLCLILSLAMATFISISSQRPQISEESPGKKRTNPIKVALSILSESIDDNLEPSVIHYSLTAMMDIPIPELFNYAVKSLAVKELEYMLEHFKHDINEQVCIRALRTVDVRRHSSKRRDIEPSKWIKVYEILLSRKFSLRIMADIDRIVSQLSSEDRFLEMIMKDNRFPVVKGRTHIDKSWYALLENSIIRGRFDICFKMLLEWDNFFSRADIDYKEILTIATEAGHKSVFILVSVLPKAFVHFTRIYNFKLSYEEYLVSLIQNNHEDQEILKIVAKVMSHSNYISYAIETNNPLMIKASIQAGNLDISDLFRLHQSGLFLELYPFIDNHFGHVDLSTLTYIDGLPAILYLIQARLLDDGNVRQSVDRLFSMSGLIGPMKTLTLLDKVLKIYRELE